MRGERARGEGQQLGAGERRLRLDSTHRLSAEQPLASRGRVVTGVAQGRPAVTQCLPWEVLGVRAVCGTEGWQQTRPNGPWGGIPREAVGPWNTL